MKLVMMYFDKLKGPVAFDSVPKPISKEQEENLGGLMYSMEEEESYFEHTKKGGKDAFSSANYFFFVDSKWARGGKEMVMLCLIADEDQEPSIFESVIKKFASAIKHVAEIYKAFYIDDKTKDDPGIEKKLKLLKLLNTDCFEACRRKPEAQKPGKMLILGLRAAGKSSIINAVTGKGFSEKIKPTLGMQIIKSAVDNFRFNIYDLGGQEKLRKGWYNKNVKPNAIIYVVDLTAGKEQHEDDKVEFHRMVENFFGKDSKQKLPENTPVLIIGNKVDLNNELDEGYIEKLLHPKKAGIDYKIGICSALNGDGLEDSFKWLVKAFLFV
ncbi:MAG: ADP-ribosylation factor-like protein [Promethearchaeota archaeon]